jgi:hypothetical protein
MSEVHDDPSLGYLRGDILDGRFPPDDRRVPRLGRWIAGLEYPWDGLFIAGVAAGLYSGAILGALLVIWSHGSILEVASGIFLVVLAAGLASHIVYTAEHR